MFSDMVKTFLDATVVDKKLLLVITNERGVREEADDLGGVMRDILSAFWNEFFKGHAIGCNAMIPCIRHDFLSQDWKSVSRILVKGFREVSYFPLRLSKEFVMATIFGESSLSSEVLLKGILQYVSNDDRDVLEAALKKKEIDVMGDDQDIVEILSALSSKRVPNSGADLKEVLLEITHQEIVQRPSYIREAWEEVLPKANIFRSPEELDSLYEDTKPTGKKVVGLLQADAKTEQEREVFGYLKKFVRSLKSEDVMKFMRFATGADTICVKSIDIIFNKLTGYERRVIAHTCGPTLELPVSYDSFAQFKEEFLNELKSGYWNMDFA